MKVGISRLGLCCWAFSLNWQRNCYPHFMRGIWIPFSNSIIRSTRLFISCRAAHANKCDERATFGNGVEEETLVLLPHWWSLACSRKKKRFMVYNCMVAAHFLWMRTTLSTFRYTTRFRNGGATDKRNNDRMVYSQIFALSNLPIKTCDGFLRCHILWLVKNYYATLLREPAVGKQRLLGAH